MNEETIKFVESDFLKTKYKELKKTHCPIKAEIRDDILIGIGLLIVKFQRLEFTIKNFIVFLLEKLHEREMIEMLIGRVPYKELVGIMIAVSAKTTWSYHEDVLQLSKLANEAAKIRNDVVHSIWFHDGRMKKKLNKKTGEVKAKFEKYSDKDIKNIAGAIDELDTCIDALAFRYVEEATNSGRKIPGVKTVSS